MDRKTFLKLTGGCVLAATAGMMSAACAAAGDEEAKAAQGEMTILPASDPNPESMFGVDSNINMGTIDDYLGRPDVIYRDMRLVRDPADYESIGGDRNLTVALEGFKVVPFPYVGTLPQLPVSGAYDGDTLFNIEWDEQEDIVQADPNYEQSMLIVEDLFPKDRPIFLMCGGAGYASQMKKLLIYLGWDESLLYNIGGAWEYTGYHAVQIMSAANGEDEYFLWRLDMAPLDFSQYTPL